MRKRCVYVIELKLGNRKWREMDCFISSDLKSAMYEKERWQIASQDEKFRIVKYYPRDDKEIV